MIDAERLDRDQDLLIARDGVGDLLHLEDFGSTRLGDDNRAHPRIPSAGVV
jgi:hypothetical protein